MGEKNVSTTALRNYDPRLISGYMRKNPDDRETDGVNKKRQISRRVYLPALAVRFPWKRAAASSLSLGIRDPSPPAMVPAPYGLPPVISSVPI
jgi:hypothetical protein